ncbi:MAG: TRAP transporter small permease subunit [Pseudomonadales bacterium]|nr:TRAP transporter small permease subunit [Pseudomonadales bacterium]
MTKLIDRIDRVSEWTGISIAWLTIVMMFLTCAVVIARYLFNVGSIAMQESVVYLHGMVFMLGIAYTLKREAHVRVDIIYQKLSQRSRAIIDLFGSVCFLLPVAGFIFWSSLDYVSFSWSVRESSPEPGGLPGVYILKTLIPLMAFTLALQGVNEILRNLAIIMKKD